MQYISTNKRQKIDVVLDFKDDLPGTGQFYLDHDAANVLRIWRHTVKYYQPEPISKRHLRPDVSVAVLLKMLTYAHVCCAFSAACALISNLI
jgi:hypothetical protein